MFVYGLVFIIWFFVLWGATEVLTLATIIIIGFRIRDIIKSHFGNQNPSFEMTNDDVSNYDGGQYVV